MSQGTYIILIPNFNPPLNHTEIMLLSLSLSTTQRQAQVLANQAGQKRPGVLASSGSTQK